MKLNILPFVAVRKLKEYNLPMSTTSQKFRLLIYIIIIPILLFLFPIINQAIQNKGTETPAPAVSGPAQKMEVLRTLATKETVLFSDVGSNIWSPVERTSQIKVNSDLACYGKDSGLLVKTPDNVIIGLGANSKIGISKHSDGSLLLTPYYGCVGVKVEDPLGKDINISFMSGVKKTRILGQKIFCKNKQDDELIETQAEVFIDKDVNTAQRPKLKNISPCKDIIEVDDAGGSSASATLRFVAPTMVNKMLLVSTNPDFTDTAFTAKTYSSEVKTSPLGKGKYFWRVKNESTNDVSEACSFDVIYHADITPVSPKNNESISDNSIDLSWNAINGINKYVLVITKDLSKVVQRLDVDSNSTKIDDPIQVLGPGAYYWRVETKEGKVSPYRRFFVYTGNDLVVDSPKQDDVIRPSDKFFIINWNPLPMVKSYSVMISSNQSFVSSEYANTTNQPFVFIEAMKEGKYYLKVSAVFDNNTKIVTDVIPFSVYDIPDVVVSSPSAGSSMDVSTDKITKIKWEPVDKATEYLVLINDEQPVKTAAGRTDADVMVSLGGNKVQIETYCGTGLQKRLCAKSRVTEFFVNNVIEAPMPPLIKYPYSRKIFKGGQVSMEWTASKGASGYKIEMSKDKDFADMKETDVQVTKFSVDLDRGIYYWRLYAYTDKTGSKIYSKPTEKRLFIVK
jgi:hypothetical protein